MFHRLCALRRTAVFACAALLTLPGCGGGAVTAAERARMPIVIVALDGVPERFTGLGAAPGAPSYTPVLDELAREGLAYSACLASEPWSHLALAGALRGSTEQGAPTLATTLERAGWRSIAVVSHDSVATEEVLEGFTDVRRLGVGDEAGALASDAVQVALGAFDSTDPRPPFVLLHLADARPPHHRYKGLVAACDAPYLGPCAAALPHSELLRLAPTFGPKDFARLSALVASEVAAVDQALGALLAGLARRAVSDDVLLVVIGTRGAWLGEGGHVGLMPGLDPEVLQVPFVVRLPRTITRARSGLALQGIIDTPVLTLDLAPTLLDALALDASREARAARAVVDAAAPRADGASPAGVTSGAPPRPQMLGRTRGASVLPGSPAREGALRLGTQRGLQLAATYAAGAGVVRDLEHGREWVVPFGPTGGPDPEATAATLGLAVELDAWIGPLPAPSRAKRR
ncbi:MAG: sulfatase-like hydrolase/transferase [Planctomycetota bacterium]